MFIGKSMDYRFSPCVDESLDECTAIAMRGGDARQMGTSFAGYGSTEDFDTQKRRNEIEQIKRCQNMGLRS